MASNILFNAENARASGSWNSWVSYYSQANCKPSITNQKFRIYRTPDHDGRAISGSGWDNWGGIKFTPILSDSSSLIKGHTYIIKFLVEGSTCDSISSFGWTNNMGWGGGGLSPAPSDVTALGIEANFDGTRECWYKWTITDDVYKVCTTSYSSFVAGETYPSYRDFMFGCSYSYTNSVGTDLYISNVRMYDLTADSEVFSANKNGNIIATSFYDNISSAQIFKDSEFQCSNIIEN